MSSLYAARTVRVAGKAEDTLSALESHPWQANGKRDSRSEDA